MASLKTFILPIVIGAVGTVVGIIVARKMRWM